MKQNIFENLITLEMANNHMGDINHGVRMIDEFAEVVNKYRDKFTFAWKFQFRDIDTFIHPSFQERTDIKYVKRFKETKLSKEQFLSLKNEASKYGFLTMCTAFDENSVDLIASMNFDIAKIASCSSTDWPLLNKVSELNIPIISSTAGTKLEDIDNIVSFFQHRNKQLAIMHCIGEYPTNVENLQLNQLDLFKTGDEIIVSGDGNISGTFDGYINRVYSEQITGAARRDAMIARASVQEVANGLLGSNYRDIIERYIDI